MKKFMFVLCCLVATSFFCVSTFGAVKIKPKKENQQVAVQKQYSAEETAAANLWELSAPLNPDWLKKKLIFPGQPVFFAFPNENDRWISIPEKGDYPLKMARNLVKGNNAFENTPQWYLETPKMMPYEAKEKANVQENFSNFDWLYIWLFFFISLAIIIFLGLRCYNLWKELINTKEQADNENRDLKNQISNLENKIKEIEKKLPIEAPAIVDEEWLKNNNPVNVNPNSIDDLVFSGNKVLGQKPQLIAKVLVSTGENSINMNFSYNRMAKTGLTDVPIYLGWNWDVENNEWAPIGMIASVCSNGFEVSPEKVVPIRELFTKFDLVPDQHPIVYKSENIPLKTKYPVLIRGLVIKYHEANIEDLNKAGAIVISKNITEEKK